MGEYKCHHVAAALNYLGKTYSVCVFASLIVIKYSWSLGHPESSSCSLTFNLNQFKIKYNDKKDIKVSVKNTQLLIFYVHVLQ